MSGATMPGYGGPVQAPMGYRGPVHAGGESIPARWRSLLGRGDVLIVDTETTGTGRGAEVIEVSAVSTAGAVLVDALALPVAGIPADASRIHGLTLEALGAGGARTWPEVHADLVRAAHGVNVVIGWGVSFDRRLLRQTSERYGLPEPFAGQWIDVMADYGRVPGRRKCGLVAAVGIERVSVAGPAHRALADCRAVLGVMRAVAREA